MDPELRQALAQLEERLTTRIEERIEAAETRLNERIEATETRLLTAFHNWSQTYEVRARGIVATVREFEERLGMVEERLAKLERSKN